ncbi:MAG: hypothetical protein AABX32_01015 [Nanoarchaeota archaeon]
MESETKSELENIKRQLSLLAERQEHLEDALLSAEDDIAIKEAREDLKSSRTIKLSDLKKKLGM